MSSFVQQELKLCTCVVFCSAGIEVVYMCRLCSARIEVVYMCRLCSAGFALHAGCTVVKVCYNAPFYSVHMIRIIATLPGYSQVAFFQLFL